MKSEFGLKLKVLSELSVWTELRGWTKLRIKYTQKYSTLVWTELKNLLNSEFGVWFWEFDLNSKFGVNSEFGLKLKV